jgi:hypothetical protein
MQASVALVQCHIWPYSGSPSFSVISGNSQGTARVDRQSSREVAAYARACVASSQGRSSRQHGCGLPDVRWRTSLRCASSAHSESTSKGAGAGAHGDRVAASSTTAPTQEHAEGGVFGDEASSSPRLVHRKV